MKGTVEEILSRLRETKEQRLAREEQMRKSKASIKNKRKLHNTLREAEWLAQNEKPQKRKEILEQVNKERVKKKIDEYVSRPFLSQVDVTTELGFGDADDLFDEVDAVLHVTSAFGCYILPVFEDGVTVLSFLVLSPTELRDGVFVSVRLKKKFAPITLTDKLAASEALGGGGK